MRDMLYNVTVWVVVCRTAKCSTLMGKNPILELHEQTLGLLRWWLFKHTQTHYYDVS